MIKSMVKNITIIVFLFIASAVLATENQAKIKTKLNRATDNSKSNHPIFSSIKHDCKLLGKSWEKAYGIKVDKLTDISNLSEQEINQVKPIQQSFQKIGIRALADFTCVKKSTPINTATVKVFVFEDTERALNWWKKKYQYQGWEKRYIKPIDSSYRALDSKQLTKRVLLVENLWITTHHLKTGKEHLILLDDVLKKLTIDISSSN
jgi:hypothetical protein